MRDRWKSKTAILAACLAWIPAMSAIAQAPANDLCADAIEVFDGDIIMGTLLNSAQEGSTFCSVDDIPDQPDVWYRFVSPDDGFLNVSSCGSHDLPGVDAGVDTLVSFHSACDSATSLACSDNVQGVCGSADVGVLADSSAWRDVSIGQEVFIRVSRSTCTSGEFVIQVDHQELSAGEVSCTDDVDNDGDGSEDCLDSDCDGTFPCNIFCSSAVVMSDVPFVQINGQYGGVASNLPPSCAMPLVFSQVGLWYNYTPPQDCLGVMSVTPSDVYVTVYTADFCSSLTEVACAEGGLQMLLAAGETTRWFVNHEFIVNSGPSFDEFTFDCQPCTGSETNCNDTLDNDCDGVADCEDPDCATPGSEIACFDGFDNDCDGATDCDDADCLGGGESDCSDGVDNDCDSLIDCADPECQVGPETLCTDGADNDCDGHIDCDDSDCDTGIESNCFDGVDNDCDWDVDCADSDCAAVMETNCLDGLDNDCDGMTDCGDADCSAIPECQISNTSCDNATVMAAPSTLVQATEPASNNTVWFQVEGTGTTLTASTCHPGTTVPSSMEIVCRSCATLHDVAEDEPPTCADDTCTLPGEVVPGLARITWCTELGVTYWIRVTTAETGLIELQLSDQGAACIDAAECLPCELNETDCFDGFDGDCDGLQDCGDPDCGVAAETECLDGLDNDCDGNADCFDEDCDGITECQSPNATCETATPLSLPADVTAWNLASQEPGGQMWYVVEGTGSTMTATTCAPGTETDTDLAINCRNCAGQVSVAFAHNTTDGYDPACDPFGVGHNDSATVTWCTEVGSTYLIRLRSTPRGQFQLLVEDNGDSCTSSLPCNANCGNGVIDAGEECDDGGFDNYDGCDTFCLLETSCATASDCCDINGDLVRDDPCTWCACQFGFCDVVDKSVPSDMAGSFGQCFTDTFCNLHDGNHVLTCFSGTNACDSINIDAGGDFGQCPLDGFCNLHDRNHAVTCFAGTNTCACGPQPGIPSTPHVVGESALELVTDKRSIAPGDTVRIDVLLTDEVKQLQSAQLEVLASGGSRGALELISIAVEPQRNFAFSGSSGAFEAFNVNNGQMMVGSDHDVAVRAGAYLATYTYRASKSASGRFVIDVVVDDTASSQTFLVASAKDKVAIRETRPVVVHVAR
jgi:hypothetical protein